MDIVLCSKRSIKIFGDKGIYPIETVYGAFSVTATLTKAKLDDSVNEFSSIPKKPNFILHELNGNIALAKETINRWHKLFPYKYIWAYKGEISSEWAEELNQMVLKDNKMKDLLPDLIVVNKVGMIEKNYFKTGELSTEKVINSHFNYVDFSGYNNPGACFAKMLHSLYFLSTWENENRLLPKYEVYFNKDL